MDMRSSTEFARLKGISDLAKRMAKTKKDTVHRLIYLFDININSCSFHSHNKEDIFSKEVHEE